jgi:S1-C subfamily serine protease
VPAALTWRIADTLAREGSVRRGYLGIATQPVRIPATQRAGHEYATGILVVEVTPGSPAERAGLLLGDILLTVDGERVEDGEGLQALLVGQRMGRTVLVEVSRGGAVARLSVTVGQRPGRPR